MAKQTIIHHISKLYTPCSNPPVKGRDMATIQIFENAYVILENGMITAVGSGQFPHAEEVFLYDAKGAILVPGFVDSHTHLVHGGSREHEFAWKIAGVPYLEILRRGGGIHSTVQATRERSDAQLTNQALGSLAKMLAFGVTTIEAKSGYGLEWVTERRQLMIANQLNSLQPIEIHSTYLGAHAVPKAFLNDRKAYITQLLLDIEKVAKERLADAVDVFCEEGVFTVSESELILNAAKRHGLKMRIHADEIVSLGGAGLAARLGAVSADHLMAASDADILLLGQTNTVANLLPGTSFYLNKPYANARKMIEANVAIAVSSDYNPGSSPSENYQLILQLAANQLRMTPPEVLNAATINPAYHLGQADRIGSIAVGKQADLVLLDAPNWEYVLYHYGVNHTQAVFKHGQLVYEQLPYRRNHETR
jgi:imidazolonepropionase